METTVGSEKQRMMGSATPSSSEPSQDIFGRLPKEVLLDIIKLSPDLSCLWSIINSSSTMDVLFTKFALEIVESVVATTVPVPTQALMWALLRARGSKFPSLDEARKVTSISPTPLSPAEIKDSNSLRYFVSLGHKIHVLAHACIDHFIQESMALRPSSLVKFPETYGSIKEMYENAEGHEYQPRSSGSPSWVEEQRTIKAFWRIELFSELNTARSTRSLNWSKEELDTFATTSLGEFYTVKEFEVQQILTVCEFLQLARWAGQSLGSMQLPDLATKDTFDLTCGPQISFGFREDRFQQDQRHLEVAPMSWNFQKTMALCKLSPVPGKPFDPYRRFGFALWDDERMTGLGFAESNRRAMLRRTDYYLTWYSVLTPEQQRERTQVRR